MPDSIEEFLSARKPTAERPLLGHTVLLVEDSRFASEAMRLLCLRSGARIRRADSLKSADRHLRTYRPSVVIVDLGLPDGSGIDLIRELSNAQPRVGVILATSGDTALAERAIKAGADGFLDKPITSLGVFQEAVLSRLPEDARPSGPRVVPEDQVMPDRLALRDDLEHVLDVLTSAENDGTLRYASRFLAGLAKTAADAELEVAAQKLERQNWNSKGFDGHLTAVTGMVEKRLRQRAVV